MFRPIYSPGYIYGAGSWKYEDINEKVPRGQGIWEDVTKKPSSYSDGKYQFRWLGPSPSGNFYLNIPEHYIIDKDSFQELNKWQTTTDKLVWKTATLTPVTQGILDAHLKKQEEKRKLLKENEAARLQSQQARAEQPRRYTSENVRKAKSEAASAAYAYAIDAGKNEDDATLDAEAAADAAVAALEASYSTAAKEGGRRRSRRRQRKQRRSRKRL